MTTQRKLAFLFIVVPLILPFFVTIAYSSFKFVKLNLRPLSIQNEYSLEKITKETIQIVKAEESPIPEVSPEAWLFDTKPKRKEKPVLIATSPVISPEIQPPPISEKIVKEEDPFLRDWRGTLSIQKSSTQPRTQNINLDEKENKYLNYADVEGTLEWPDLDHTQFFAEVSFYDQIGANGLNDDLSTTLASQELREDSPFLLKLHAETSGHLIAKIYSASDTQKEKPLYIGRVTDPRVADPAYPQNSLFVPKEGLQRLLISMVPTAQYFDQYQTVFLGKVVDEYSLTQGISGVRIWVSETQEQVDSDEK